MALARRRTGSRFRYAPSTASAAGLCLVRSFTDKRLHPLQASGLIDELLTRYGKKNRRDVSWLGMRSQRDRFLSKLSGGFQGVFCWLG